MEISDKWRFVQEATSDPKFPKHFDGKRFCNPDASRARGLLDALRWKLTSRPSPSPGFISDVEPSVPPRRVEGSGLRTTLVNHSTAMSAIRGGGFALGAAYLYGGTFGAAFGALSTVGQVLGYRAGIRPTIDYQPATRPRLTKHQFLAAVNRTVGYAAAGYIAALTAHQSANALSVGVKTGLAIGVVTAISSACTPFIEWIADHVPEKRMGVFGVGLILTGFALQSVQYWVALLDV